MDDNTKAILELLINGLVSVAPIFLAFLAFRVFFGKHKE